MISADTIGLWIVGGIVAALLCVIAAALTPAARLRRRRRKTHSPLISTSKRPTVKLTAKTPKK